MSSITLTKQQESRYRDDGYVVVPGFFNPEQIALIYQLATEDNVTRSHAIDLNDQSGKSTKLTLWFTPGDDTYGLLTRSESLIRAVQTLLGEGEVCHFHSKLMQKEPKVGGAWEWHQDYGYWYKNGFLYPDALMSVMLALTEATRENGCLQVLKGSHKMGRFEHLFAGDQQGADMAFTEEALKINGIDLEEHKKVAVSPSEAIREFDTFLRMHFREDEKITLAGHNINFDVNFLRHFLTVNCYSFSRRFSHRYVDTATILYYLYLTGKLKEKAISSQQAFDLFGIKVKGRHTALGDAIATARLFTVLLKLITKNARITSKSDEIKPSLFD